MSRFLRTALLAACFLGSLWLVSWGVRELLILMFGAEA
jgi:hypothetical protein